MQTTHQVEHNRRGNKTNVTTPCFMDFIAKKKTHFFLFLVSLSFACRTDFQSTCRLLGKVNRSLGIPIMSKLICKSCQHAIVVAAKIHSALHWHRLDLIESRPSYFTWLSFRLLMLLVIKLNYFQIYNAYIYFLYGLWAILNPHLWSATPLELEHCIGKCFT